MNENRETYKLIDQPYLKPCPFCGCKVSMYWYLGVAGTIYYINGLHAYDNGWFGNCPFENLKYDVSAPCSTNPDMLADAWNKRYNKANHIFTKIRRWQYKRRKEKANANAT